MKVNPYEIVEMRRKLKKYDQTGVDECMKIVKRLRQMKLENEMLAITQCPRTLLYVVNRLKSVQTSDPKHTLMRMCKFLNKEWKLQFQKHLKQPDVTNSNNKDNKPDKGDDQ